MARIRTIKPEIARHELLYELERELGMPMRFAWAVLPTVCDREGRFKWRPRPLKADVLPYDELDFERLLDAFVAHGLLVKYRVADETFGCIPTFRKHQVINQREAQSELPAPPDQADQCMHVHARVEGKGREQEGKGTEDSSAPLSDAKPPVLVFPTVGTGARSWALTDAQIAEWQGLYPGIDVESECRKAWAWVNAKQRKTAKGMPAFLVNWFNRATNSAAPSRGTSARAAQAASPRPTGWQCPHVTHCTKGQGSCRQLLQMDPHGKKWPLKSAVTA